MIGNNLASASSSEQTHRGLSPQVLEYSVENTCPRQVNNTSTPVWAKRITDFPGGRRLTTRISYARKVGPRGVTRWGVIVFAYVSAIEARFWENVQKVKEWYCYLTGTLAFMQMCSVCFLSWYLKHKQSVVIIVISNKTHSLNSCTHVKNVKRHIK